MFSRWPRYAARGRPSRCGRWCTCPWPSTAAAGRDVVLAVPRLERSPAAAAGPSRGTTTSTPLPSPAGRRSPVLAGSKPLAGSSSPTGTASFTCSPGVGQRVGHRVEVQRAGERQRHGGLRAGDEGVGVGDAVVALGEVAVVAVDDGVLLAFGTSDRAHWPMHGPQALASTVAPAASKVSSRPSRSIVARTCSEPGVIISSVFTFRPFVGGVAQDRGRPGDVLVGGVGARADQRGPRPRAASRSSRASAPSSLTSRARSGVNGPLMWGCSVAQVDLDDLVVEVLGLASTSSSGRRWSATALAASAIASRPVAFR
jgi:hypothetical protein